MGSAIGLTIVVLALIVVGTAAYFLPTIIAMTRDLSNRWSVFVLNLFFGWTVLGWVICLAMSASGAPSTHANSR